MKETVRFFAHDQLRGAGEYSKAVEVKKTLDPADTEGLTQHPRWEQTRDTFTITCRYRVVSIEEVLWDQAEQDIEDMCLEVVRIIKTVYDPTAGTGAFFQSDYNWTNADDLTTSQQEVKRILQFSLTHIRSREAEVFEGFGGVLTFDTSVSTGDSKPAGDYIYTEATHVVISEGTPVTSRMTRNSSSKTGKPVKFRGKFGGTFTARIFAKKSDLDNATVESLDNIYKAQSAGELPTAVFLHANDNKEGTPVTLTTSTFVMVTNMRKTADDEQLVVYDITGDITQPTTVATA